jgi:NAD(P)H-hydrate epimerase
MSDSNSQARLTHLLKNTGIIVDALLGTGVSRPIEGTLAELLDQVKAAVSDLRLDQKMDLVDPTYPALAEAIGPVVVAVDVPSGLNSDTGQVDPHTMPADLTVTLAAVKVGHILMPGPEVVGQLIVGDIGLTDDHYSDDVSLEMATSAQVAAMMPDRSPGSHKGTFGTALIVAGSGNYTGAAVLAGQAATRIGTGLVTLAPPRSIHPILGSQLIEATYLPLPDDEGALTPEAISRLKQKLPEAEAILIGPGLGQADSTAAFLLDLLAEPDSLPPAILDADALNILATQDNWWELLPPNSILTPHPGEMSRLTGRSVQEIQNARLEVAPEMAAKWNQIVLLKGAHTVVAGPDGRTTVLPFANPALAKAGSGDVLAGALVGLLAQGLEPFEAAVAGTYFHGLSGELARNSLGATATIAGDLVGYLPLAIREVTGD